MAAWFRSTGACPVHAAGCARDRTDLRPIPALQGSRTDLTTRSKRAAGGPGRGFRQNKARSVLVVVEVALALVLLVGAALLIRTALALRGSTPVSTRATCSTMRMSMAGPSSSRKPAVELLIRNGAERLRAHARRRARQRVLLPSARRRLRSRLQHRRAPARDRPFHGGGGWYDGLVGLFRGVPHSSEARTHVRGSRRRPQHAGRDHQRSDGAAFLARRRSAERSARHRPWRDARVRDRARAADHRRRRRHARRRAEQRSAADDVHSAGSGSRTQRTH